jgi:phage/plasmid-associated DNA primase
LRALIDGCLDWQQNGLMVPECVDEKTENYFNAQDTVGKWFEECCEEHANAKVSSAEVWKSWVGWANERKLKVGTDEELSEKLEARGFRRIAHVEMPDGKRPRGWEGFRLQEQQIDMPDFGPEPPPYTGNPRK